MSRKNARDMLYKLVFEFLFSGEANQETFDLMMLDASLTDDDRKYIETAYKGVIYYYDELLAVISEHSKGFSVSRIFKPDLASLLLASYELRDMPEIPGSVVISEAVNIVKEYSTDKSYSFINGVLAGINKSLGDKTEG